MTTPFQTPAECDGPLGGWYATPLTRAQAEVLLVTAEERQQRARRSGRRCLLCRLLRLIALFWLERPVQEEFELLGKGGRRSKRQGALTELIYGQLLMSRRINGALDHIEKGFALAQDLLAPRDYFRLVKRHTLLRQLPLSDAPAPPLTLKELLTTAAVAERLTCTARVRARYWHDPNDTYG